jgi:hypothetical protein
VLREAPAGYVLDRPTEEEQQAMRAFERTRRKYREAFRGLAKRESPGGSPSPKSSPRMTN